MQETILALAWRDGGHVFALDQGGEVLRDDPVRTAMREMAGVFAGLDRRMIVKRLRDGRKAKLRKAVTRSAAIRSASRRTDRSNASSACWPLCASCAHRAPRGTTSRRRSTTYPTTNRATQPRGRRQPQPTRKEGEDLVNQTTTAVVTPGSLPAPSSEGVANDIWVHFHGCSGLRWLPSDVRSLCMG